MTSRTCDTALRSKFPDIEYRGLRINVAGNLMFQVCLDDGDRFRILVSHLPSEQSAREWIDDLARRLWAK